MNRSSFVKSFVAVSLLSSNVAFADNKGEQAGQQVAVANALTVKLPGCEVRLEGQYDIKKALAVRVEAKTELEDMAANGSREITLNDYGQSEVEKKRAAQEQAARRLGGDIARSILSPANIGNEDAMIRTQDLLANTVGKIPDGSLQSIKSILDANVGELNDPKAAPSYRAKTDNALADLTKTVTQYRKSGLDVNTLANASDKLSGIPMVGKMFASAGDILRKRFQSVKQAIAAIDSTFDEAIAQMRLRHEQMKQARLEAVLLDRYLEVSFTVLEEIERLAQEHEATIMDDGAKNLFQKSILSPIAQRKLMVQRQRMTVATAYQQFRVLMDGNLDLIVIIGNLRETTQLELSTAAAGKIIANEQNRTIRLANEALQATDALRNQTIAQIRAQGVQIREFPTKLIESTEAMLGAMDQLLAELDLARQNVPITLAAYQKSSAFLKAKMDEAQRIGGQTDYIAIADSVGNQKALNARPVEVLDAPIFVDKKP